MTPFSVRPSRIRLGAMCGILLCLWVGTASPENHDEIELRSRLDRLIERIVTLQSPDNDFSSLRQVVLAGIESIEVELVEVDRRLEEARSRLDRLARTPDRPPAPASTHWAYRPPVSPEIPDTRFRDRVRNPIDAFILRRLEEEGLEPSPEATKEQLIRRVSLDLIGLPPTWEEVDRFLKDPSPDAYEKAVDRLLDSPHFGERQAQFWLDLARTADSCGYHIDAARPMWPFRDWVISAFNRDLPFDRFTIEQLAGDLLPDPSLDQRIATGFHRNTMFNEEGGIDPEEFRVKAVTDRVGVTGTVWMGTSLACAECHDHKHDPIGQREFFEMYAFFNTTAELGGGTFATRAPLVHLFEGDQERQVEDLTTRIGDLQKTLDASTPELVEAQSAWESRMRQGIEWRPLENLRLESENGSSFSHRRDHSWIATGEAVPSTDTYRASGEWRGPPPAALRLEILPGHGESEGRIGRHEKGVPTLSEIRFSTAPAEGDAELSPVDILFPTWNTPGMEPRRIVDKNPRSGWVLGATDPLVHEAWFEIPASAWHAEGTRFTIELEQQAKKDSTLARFRLSAVTGEGPIRIPPPAIQKILQLESGHPQHGRPSEGAIKLTALSPADNEGADLSPRSFEEEETIARYYRSIAPLLEPTRNELGELDQTKKELLKTVPQALVMGEMEEPRETRVHIRGDFLRLGDRVEPGLPEIFGGLPEDLPRNRLGLAEWLIRPENPLTARVQVNRLWQQVFGRGIVETADDFGTMGSPPSHPELLDWLAVEFVRDGWSLKRTLRLIVTSSVYRQSARTTPELLEVDPYNRLLARGPRQRLSAEAIRDNALAVSGLLNRRIGGPSVFPWQPPGLWSEIGSPGYGVDDWIPSEDADRFRRGLYTFWRRSNPYPSFVAFDAPTKEYCAVKRPTTNTPLQALVTLNDPVFVEAAAGFAVRLLRDDPDAAPGERIAAAFRHCLSRRPTEKEAEKLIGLYERRMANFAKDGTIEGEGLFEEADALGIDRAELAAWTIVCQVLLNLDETITKG